MIFLSIVSAQVQRSPAASASVPPLVPRVSSLDSPTLPQLTYLSTGPRDGIRIIRRIGANYHSLGILLLNDDDGAITTGIIAGNHHQPENITRDVKPLRENITRDILSKWLQGQGRQPVTWATLITVLHEIELSELAQDIAPTMT